MPRLVCNILAVPADRFIGGLVNARFMAADLLLGYLPMAWLGIRTGATLTLTKEGRQ